MENNHNQSKEFESRSGSEFHTSDLLDALKYGCVLHDKRWSGDTHFDLGGSVDEEATDYLMTLAAERIEALEDGIRECLKENRHLADGDVCTLRGLKDLLSNREVWDADE